MVRQLYTVLRTGGEYTLDHVALLRDQLKKQEPDAELVCVTDNVSVSIEGVKLLKAYNMDWPKWWAKMNLFDPEIEGDMLYCDLDTVIIGSLDDFWNAEGDIILRDFYRRHGLGSGLMRLTEERRYLVWQHWIADPWYPIRAYQMGGDQAYLEVLGLDWKLWQDILPNAVASFKADIDPIADIPDGTKIVCFHGKPRPWEVKNTFHREWIDNAAL